MTEKDCCIVSNKAIGNKVFRLVVEGDMSAISKPGQFVNIKLEGLFLRRPLSVCQSDAHSLTMLYKAVGKGTEQLSSMQPGEKLSTLLGLGNGFDTEKSGEKPLLIGGGLGVSPLYGLCECLVAQGKKPTVILGFNTAAEVIYESEFKALGAEIIITTVDGSRGIKGFAADAMMGREYSYFYTCGPEAMFRSVDKAASTGGQFSFEERMGCGFGACMGCSCQTKYGSKRICRDGPVLEREEIVW